MLMLVPPLDRVVILMDNIDNALRAGEMKICPRIAYHKWDSRILSSRRHSNHIRTTKVNGYNPPSTHDYPVDPRPMGTLQSLVHHQTHSQCLIHLSIPNPLRLVDVIQSNMTETNLSFGRDSLPLPGSRQNGLTVVLGPFLDSNYLRRRNSLSMYQ